MKYFMILVLCLVSLVVADNRPTYWTDYIRPYNQRTMVLGSTHSSGDDGSSYAQPGYISTGQNTFLVGPSLRRDSDGYSHAYPGYISTNRQSYNY